MSIKIICSLWILTLLSACTATLKPAPIFIPAIKQVVQQSAIDRVGNYHFKYGSDPALEQAFSRYLKSGKAPNIVGKGFVSFAYSPDQEPIINTAPLQETVISLQPGEKFENISSGDPSRWSYAVATSGQGPQQQQHILIKPSVPSVSTNMVITTNKRIYNLRLVSVASPDSSSMRTIRFWYPQEMHTATESISDQNSVANISLNQLNFDYLLNSLSGSSLPDWAPTRVFDDGTHTYIQFPSNMATKDLPVLFVLRGKADELVNYRYQAPYFVVDKIFKQAVLVLGTGKAQQKLLISNQVHTRAF